MTLSLCGASEVWSHRHLHTQYMHTYNLHTCTRMYMHMSPPHMHTPLRLAFPWYFLVFSIITDR